MREFEVNEKGVAMNAQEREAFWNTLCSLPGTDPKTESEKLGQTIKYPRFLYRYRSVSSKSLEALRTNKLYFSTANYYDDPFDTFLHIDIDEIRNVFSGIFQTPERIGAVVDVFRLLFDGIFTEEQKDQITVENVTKALSQGLLVSFLNFALALRNEVKKDIWSVCFSENGFNEVLWLKYANQYRGFVQIYDLENKELFQEARIKLLYLPAYSPELNPIEKMWSKLKSILRKLKIRSLPLLPQGIAKAFSQICPSDCIGWFSATGVC